MCGESAGIHRVLDLRSSQTLEVGTGENQPISTPSRLRHSTAFDRKEELLGNFLPIDIIGCNVMCSLLLGLATEIEHYKSKAIILV